MGNCSVDKYFRVFGINYLLVYCLLGYLSGSVVKNSRTSAGDVRDEGLIPGSGRSPRVGKVNPLQYFCLENPMGRGAWQVIVHGVTKEFDMS